ncbi:hypothetical protein B0T22DRAFT_460761 [Podospora appendiculata]|uniref:Uncharacterized protein n=1 Tax=Podospora appendiculata TaxID=314037 RepID=A0AAE0XAT8_9PEZI|nr:hypothetical protein B0T22DRAFT_460761 [Podospora appendiculata]
MQCMQQIHHQKPSPPSNNDMNWKPTTALSTVYTTYKLGYLGIHAYSGRSTVAASASLMINHRRPSSLLPFRVSHLANVEANSARGLLCNLPGGIGSPCKREMVIRHCISGSMGMIEWQKSPFPLEIMHIHGSNPRQAAPRGSLHGSPDAPPPVHTASHRACARPLREVQTSKHQANLASLGCYDRPDCALSSQWISFGVQSEPSPPRMALHYRHLVCVPLGSRIPTQCSRGMIQFVQSCLFDSNRTCNLLKLGNRTTDEPDQSVALPGLDQLFFHT